MYVYLSLGTNLGDEERDLHLAVQKIEERIRRVISLSAFHATAPQGSSPEHTFLNAAACMGTLLPPLSALRFTQEIEREMGRTHESVGRVCSDRVIDINLLLYGDQVLDTPELKLSYLLMRERRFVLEPLTEVIPDLIHLVLKKKILELS